MHIFTLQVQHKGPPIQMIGCGAEFSAVVDIKGNLYTFGSPEYGQLGEMFKYNMLLVGMSMLIF